MNNLKMTLANNEDVMLDSVSIPLHIVINCASKISALNIWALMTSENLANVKFYDGNEKTAEFNNVEITGVQYIMNPDGGVTAHFYLSGENVSSGNENEYVTAARILLGEEE